MPARKFSFSDRVHSRPADCLPVRSLRSWRGGKKKLMSLPKVQLCPVSIRALRAGFIPGCCGGYACWNGQWVLYRLGRRSSLDLFCAFLPPSLELKCCQPTGAFLFFLQKTRVSEVLFFFLTYSPAAQMFRSAGTTALRWDYTECEQPIRTGHHQQPWRVQIQNAWDTLPRRTQPHDAAIRARPWSALPISRRVSSVDMMRNRLSLPLPDSSPMPSASTPCDSE